MHVEREAEVSRPLRADAERSVRAILEAAERVLAEDPSASMEQIAEAAGLTRITVHRRFASRQALIEALATSAKQQLIDAVEAARPDTAPALVALHRVTANVLQVKNTWRFTLSQATVRATSVADFWDDIDNRTLELLARGQREGLLAPAADLVWTRQVYYSLLNAALKAPDPNLAPEALATLVVDTLLHGAGPHR